MREGAEEIGFPVAIKILSHDITHKSDVGGIALNVRSAPEAANQFVKITERVHEAKPDADIIGVAVEAMSRGGYEVILGSKKDPTFGPAMMFGMGGTGVELYRDVAVDFPPVNQALAQSMIQSTKVSQLLRGYRGKAPVDMVALEQALVKMSYLLVDFPEILEMDINPLQVRTDGVCALDARIVIEPKDVRKIALPGAHLMISMYPSKYRWEVPLDGEDVVIRAIKPEDEPLWADMIESLSPATAEYRFFGPIKEVTKSMLVRYCHIDYDREIALAAIREPKGKKKKMMLGVARLTIETANVEEGEFAIVDPRRLPAQGHRQQAHGRAHPGGPRPARARDPRPRAGGQPGHDALRRGPRVRRAAGRRAGGPGAGAPALTGRRCGP